MKIEERFYAPSEIITKNGGILCLSLSAVYAAIKKGEIPTKEVGKRKMIPYWFLQAIIKEG